eukprot:scaffold721_cov88-Isochrysis_galbana.AAC.3
MPVLASHDAVRLLQPPQQRVVLAHPLEIDRHRLVLERLHGQLPPPVRHKRRAERLPDETCDALWPGLEALVTGRGGDASAPPDATPAPPRLGLASAVPVQPSARGAEAPPPRFGERQPPPASFPAPLPPAPAPASPAPRPAAPSGCALASCLRMSIQTSGMMSMVMVWPLAMPRMRKAPCARSRHTMSLPRVRAARAERACLMSMPVVWIWS